MTRPRNRRAVSRAALPSNNIISNNNSNIKARLQARVILAVSRRYLLQRKQGNEKFQIVFGCCACPALARLLGIIPAASCLFNIPTTGNSGAGMHASLRIVSAGLCLA
jgi:hypothetical protein